MELPIQAEYDHTQDTFLTERLLGKGASVKY